MQTNNQHKGGIMGIAAQQQVYGDGVMVDDQFTLVSLVILLSGLFLVGVLLYSVIAVTCM